MKTVDITYADRLRNRQPGSDMTGKYSLSLFEYILECKHNPQVIFIKVFHRLQIRFCFI